MLTLPDYNYIDLVDRQEIFGYENTLDPFFYDFIAMHGDMEVYLNSFMLKIRQVYEYMPKDLSGLSTEALLFFIRWAYGDNLNFRYGVRGYYPQLIELMNFFSESEDLICYFSILLYTQLSTFPLVKLEKIHEEYRDNGDLVEFIFEILTIHKQMGEGKSPVSQTRMKEYQERIEECMDRFFELNKEINTNIKLFSRARIYTDTRICLTPKSNKCIRANSTLLYVRFPVLKDALKTNFKNGEITVSVEKLELDLTELRILMNYYYRRYFDIKTTTREAMVSLLEKLQTMHFIDRNVYGGVGGLINILQGELGKLYGSDEAKSLPFMSPLRSEQQFRSMRSQT